MRIAAAPCDWPQQGPLATSQLALLIIDMQWDFCHQDGYVGQMGLPVERLRQPIPRIRKLLRAARANDVTVVYTRQGYRRDLADVRPEKRQDVRDGGSIVGRPGPLGRALIREEAGWQIIPELEPIENEVIVDKTANSSFYGTDLDAILRVAGIRGLIVSGNTLDVCVHSTIRSATDRGYECLLVEDACGCSSAELATAACAMIRIEDGVFGCTATADVVVDALRGSPLT